MRTRTLRTILAGAAAALAALLAPGAALARDGFVTSFDGTKIVYSFFPAPGAGPGKEAATVMFGPGYSMSRAGADDATTAALLEAGYNVLTFDPRGFGDSGGNVEIDGPDYEARDAQALIDYLAGQPEVQRDAPGDPRLGMIGASYGGGIQHNTAAIDKRVDVITPQIAWHSLVTSLDKSNTAKGGWGSLLFGLGINGTTTSGVTGGATGQPAGFQFGRMQDPRAQTALTNGAATGEFTAEDQAFFASRGPGDQYMGRIRIPTLLSQGTNDTLFTLHEAIENYRILRGNDVPVKMIWFCGGLTDPSAAHGVCNTSLGPDPAIVLHESLHWLDRYLRGRKVDTGPRFEWISDVGARHSAPDYPTAQGPAVTGDGAGTLPLVPGSTSGALIEAEPAANAVNVALRKPPAGTRMLGEPTLRLEYSGTAPSSNGRVYAQIVDDQSRLVLGNQVTPVPVTLDGKPHTTTIPLEAVAVDPGPATTYTLQITDGSNVYFAARQPGTVTLSKIGVSVPTAGTGTGAGTGAGAGRACTSRRRFPVHLKRRYRSRVRSAQVKIGGRTVGRLRGARAVRVDLRGRPAGRVTVRIVMRLRGGRTLIDVRRYRLCVPR